MVAGSIRVLPALTDVEIQLYILGLETATARGLYPALYKSLGIRVPWLVMFVN